MKQRQAKPVTEWDNLIYTKERTPEREEGIERYLEGIFEDLNGNVPNIGLKDKLR